MAIPDGKSVYDIQGTNLFRVISRGDHELEMEGQQGGSEATSTRPSSTGSTAAKKPQPVMMAGGGFSMSTRYGPGGTSSMLRPSTKARRLIPLGGAAPLPEAVGPRSLTAERALAQLFTPTPLLVTADGTLEEVPVTSGGGSKPNARPTSGRSGRTDRLSHVTAMTERMTTTATARRGNANDCPWMKVASLEHTSRLDVVLLQEHLHELCRSKHARAKGVLCSTREQIFDDGLKELTRQITVLCPERGLLLDELCKGMSQATDTYDILFDSACQYAVRKSIERNLRSYLFDDKKTLESEVRRLENRVNELRAKYEGMMKRFEEQKTANAKLHEEEIAYIKKANQQLTSEIKRLAV